jgi:hypothetical protein
MTHGTPIYTINNDVQGRVTCRFLNNLDQRGWSTGALLYVNLEKSRVMSQKKMLSIHLRFGIQWWSECEKIKISSVRQDMPVCAFCILR